MSVNGTKKYIDILKRIGDLLGKYDHGTQRIWVDRLAVDLKNGMPPLSLITNDIWGGMGSVTDCHLALPVKDETAESLKDDRREFNCLIALLAEELIKDGIANDRVKQLGQTYSEWARKL